MAKKKFLTKNDYIKCYIKYYISVLTMGSCSCAKCGRWQSFGSICNECSENISSFPKEAPKHSSKTKPFCVFYNTINGCNNGIHCPFVHNRQVCRNAENCPRRDKCNFSGSHRKTTLF